MRADRPRILVSAPIHSEVHDRLAGLGDVVVNPSADPWPQKILRQHLRKADAWMAFMHDRVLASDLGDAPRLRIIAGALKGADNFDAKACAARGIWLSNVDDLLTAPTAELAIGLMIGVGRHFLGADSYVRSGRFNGWTPRFYGTGLERANILILGMGAIGKAIAERLAAFGCDMAYWDKKRLQSTEERRLKINFSTPDEALARPDFILCALPLNEDTLGLISNEWLARCKPGAILVNVSRGSVVDELAVSQALSSGSLLAYAADVFAFEDWKLSDRPRSIPPELLAMSDRTLFTPHLGSAIKSARLAIELEAAANIEDALSGRRPRSAINEPIDPKRP